MLVFSPLPSSLAPALPALWPQPTANSNLPKNMQITLHIAHNIGWRYRLYYHKMYHHYHSHCTFISVRFRFLRTTALSCIEVKVGYILSDGGSSWPALLWLLLQLSLPDLGQPCLKEGLTLSLKLLSLLTLSVRLRGDKFTT